jgi:hypothetical protein
MISPLTTPTLPCPGALLEEAESSSIPLARAPLAGDIFPVRSAALPEVDGPMTLRRTLDAAERDAKLQEIIPLRRDQKLSWREIEDRTGIPFISARRFYRKYEAGGFAALLDNCHKCGGKPKIRALTEEEATAAREVFLRANVAQDACSMLTAAKFWLLDNRTAEDLRGALLPEVEAGRLPNSLKRIFERVTPTHIAAHRRPGMAATENFSGTVGAFFRDKHERRRVIESDDGTLNFAAWIPWPMGGDKCSDRYGVRVGRWQFLPAMDAGWTHMYLGYALVCRPRGSYRQEDVRSLIWTIAQAHGLPDAFRFERGTWESDSIVNIIRKLGVELATVRQSNHKPFIEGGFNVLWTYLGMMPGQVGRYRGDEERGNKLVQQCRAGSADPRHHFPSLAECIAALNGAMAMRNSDTIKSIYGKWVPEERHAQLKVDRPWRQLPVELHYLFSPYVREWTVRRATIGGDVPILDDYSAPFYFASDELFRFNGRKLRCYFDHTATPCLATIVATEEFHGYKPDEVVCRAELDGELPHFCRAARGWADADCVRTVQWRKAAMSALRRDLRALDTRGQIIGAASEARDGHGAVTKVESGTPRPDPLPASAERENTPPSRRGGWRLQQMMEQT